MRTIITLVIAMVVARASVQGATAPLPTFDIAPLEHKAAALFNPEYLSRPGAPLSTACDHLLLFCQALSALIIVAGLVARMRDEQTQMEGVAATLIKVAFIATIPLWRAMVLDLSDVVAGSVGYESVSAAGKSSPVMHDLWTLMENWVPPGTPYLDVLQAQDAANRPASGDEQSWGLNAWNWARGVGATDATLFHAMWQTASGSVRALAVFGGSALLVCCLSATIMLCYLGELLRYVVFFGGCALLPVFIAALSLETLRSASVKFISGTLIVAFWPVGWALGNILTQFMAQALESWMSAVATTALTAAGFDAPSASMAVAAPYVSWGALFLFLGLAFALCVWVIGALVGGPWLISRAAAAGSVLARSTFTAMREGTVRGSSMASWTGRFGASATKTRGVPTTVATTPAAERASTELRSVPLLRRGAALGSAAAPLRPIALSRPAIRRRRE